MNPRDGIYIGMGNKDISFKCVDIENPPKFYVSVVSGTYIVSCCEN